MKPCALCASSAFFAVKYKILKRRLIHTTGIS